MVGEREVLLEHMRVRCGKCVLSSVYEEFKGDVCRFVWCRVCGFTNAPMRLTG